MAGPGTRPSRMQLVLECAQRERSCVPAAAGITLALVAPAAAFTWVLAPLLVLSGAASFAYDLFGNEEFHAALAARLRAQQEALQDLAVMKLTEHMPEGDQRAAAAVRRLEKSVLEKIPVHQKALELTGTFSHTYVDMVRSVAGAAMAALRRKGALLETAAKLAELKADEEAGRLCEQIPALDDRIEQARATLDEVLTQLMLLGTETDVAQLAHLADALCARLKVADQAARDAAGSALHALPPALRVEPLPGAADPERERKKKRQGER